MDITTLIPLIGMFSVGLLCIKKPHIVASHLIRHFWTLKESHLGLPGKDQLEKQLRTIAYVGGWFFCLLSVAGALIYLI